MITKSYFKLVKVSHADSDLFRVTNVDTTAGTLTIGAGSNLGKNLEYSTDGVNFTTADPNAPFSLTVPAGANVYMRGTNSNWYTGSQYTPNPRIINMDVNHTVGGNVYSLLDKATYASRTTSVGTREFYYMFNNNTHLVSAADMNFGNVTTLADFCYLSMFEGCTALTSAPAELPATTLAESCYNNMFKGCTSLTTAPELTATNLTLADYCCFQMFYGCTSLTTAPELPATTLANSCYRSMFSGCTSLNSVKCLAEAFASVDDTYDWLQGVSATGTFYKSANMSDWTTGTNGIPSGWTVIDA